MTPHDISPTSPNKTEVKLNIPKLEPIISTPKPITGSPSGARDSFEDESQPISGIVCTGLPFDSLMLGCPWVYKEDGIEWHEITVIIPMPKNQVK